jgi:hypothetical protein
MTSPSDTVSEKMIRVEHKLDTLIGSQQDYNTQLKELRNDLRDLELKVQRLLGMLTIVGSIIVIAIPTVLSIIRLIGE